MFNKSERLFFILSREVLRFVEVRYFLSGIFFMIRETGLLVLGFEIFVFFGSVEKVGSVF